MTSLPAAGQQAAERLRRSRFSGRVDRQLLADVLVPFVATRVLLAVASSLLVVCVRRCSCRSPAGT